MRGENTVPLRPDGVSIGGGRSAPDLASGFSDCVMHGGPVSAACDAYRCIRLRPFHPRLVGRCATSSHIDPLRKQLPVDDVVAIFERGLEQAVEFTARIVPMVYQPSAIYSLPSGSFNSSLPQLFAGFDADTNIRPRTPLRRTTTLYPSSFFSFVVLHYCRHVARRGHRLQSGTFQSGRDARRCGAARSPNRSPLST